ncbi:STAS domain-containing protein [Saccharopolyspora phatthalungensis]|uniref:Anti-anti-sigma factor n=1 Tax=Saccharopolyspora phatthalungensis TaxID=664693 RepID=A0A840QIB1_9PSEU|nr:STAS domain-containing protein [Saccharopolyspora phatthalungensis]MBB5158439.1 anti-anti-sigma factor [Saccharopolyspora phatthalungensis]
MSFAELGRTEVPAPRTELRIEDRTPGAEALRLNITRPVAGVVVIEAAGVLDMDSATRFAEVVRANLSTDTRTAVLDLSALSFLSTHGVVALLEAAHRALMRETDLLLVTQNRIVDRLLGMLDVASRFTYAATVDAAIQAAGSQSSDGVRRSGCRVRVPRP